jgi:hypothetical protein
MVGHVAFWYLDDDGGKHYVKMGVEGFITAVIRCIPDGQFLRLSGTTGSTLEINGTPSRRLLGVLIIFLKEVLIICPVVGPKVSQLWGGDGVCVFIGDG